MKSLVSFLKKVNLSRILTAFLVGVAFFFMQGFAYNQPAQAGNHLYFMSYEVNSYGTNRPDSPYPGDNLTEGNRLMDNAQDNLKSTADNVREKLNLDEPMPQSTKDFLNSVQDSIENAIENITGSEEGYSNRATPDSKSWSDRR